MIRNALVLSLAMSANFVSPAFADELAPVVNLAKDVKVEWPDYKSKPWTMVKQKPLAVEVQVPVRNNRYVPGPGRYDVLVGTIMIFIDSPDIQKSAMLVSEADVLGKGSVLRVLQMRNVGVLSAQLKVDGKWENVPRDSSVILDVVDPERAVFKGELQGVILRMMEGETEKLKVVIENKPADPPKK